MNALHLALSIAFADPALTQPPDSVYHGRDGRTVVSLPRLEQSIKVDGNLNEPAWADAAVLTGFSQYQPVDRRPARDSTEVLVWYAPDAIYFGVRAYSPAGSVNANLSDRDKIGADDGIDIILNTFNDGRQAFVFGVNALGVQADGTINEAVISSGGRNSPTASSADLSANYVYESKGRVTAYGYEVEVRIPFKSLRYQSTASQDWGLQIIRRVQYLGHENTWTPAARDAASLLAQSGTLKGLNGLQRGVVVDINPSVVGRETGGPRTDNSWRYVPSGPELGGQVRWGVTNNHTLNAAINPDFSQVEADVVAFQFDPRQALFFPERRPFFLEGIENFSAPDGLIYTRSITKPDLAVKLTGKSLGTNIAVLSALDDRTSSYSDGHPFLNIVRAVRDVGKQNRIGFTYTDRYDADDVNRVAAVDARVVARDIWSFTGHVANSYNRSAVESGNSPLFSARLNRNGRRYDFNANLLGVSEDFQARAGFIGRNDVVDYGVSQTLTFFPGAGKRVESWGVGIRHQQTGRYQAMMNGRASQDRKLHFNSNMAVRGGWRFTASIFIESFGFDSLLYQDYYIDRDLGAGLRDTVKFTGGADRRLNNLDLLVTAATPQWSRFSADVFYAGGKDENFEEWQSGLVHFFTLNLRYRPTDQLRVEGQYQLQQFNRWEDRTTVSERHVPRIKVEYQAGRYIFFRVVGQYDSQVKDDRRDDERTNDPLLLRGSNGSFTRLAAFKRNRIRADWLFSYQPTPGTVFFLGYGSTLAEAEPFKFNNLQRTQDGFFVKWSYLFRLN